MFSKDINSLIIFPLIIDETTSIYVCCLVFLYGIYFLVLTNTILYGKIEI